jgi:hypothetical protein
MTWRTMEEVSLYLLSSGGTKEGQGRFLFSFLQLNSVQIKSFQTLKKKKRAKVKPLNYSQVTSVQQGPDDSPSAFVQRLKDTLQKHTTMDPELQVGEVLLKDKFLT